MSTLATILWITWSLSLAVGLYAEVWHRYIRASDRVEKLYRAAGRIHQELWLFVPPGIVISTGDDFHHRPWMLLFDAISMFNWWNYRNWPEDNHWKRRGKKLKDAVKVRAGRLVVVPAGAN